MLVDADTLEPARDGFSRVFGEPTERIKPELFESFVEITTSVVETADEAERELRAPRGQHATALGRLAAPGVRDARGARHGPADLAAPNGRARGRGAATRA